MGDNRDGRRRREHQTQSQQRDGPEIGAKFTQRCEVRRRPQDRRQEDEKDEVRIETNHREAGHHGQKQPADDQENRVGKQELARDRRQRDYDRQEHDDDFDLLQASGSHASVEPVTVVPAVIDTLSTLFNRWGSTLH
jgi:hypothetical protein